MIATISGLLTIEQPWTLRGTMKVSMDWTTESMILSGNMWMLFSANIRRKFILTACCAEVGIIATQLKNLWVRTALS